MKFDGFMRGVNLGGWLSQCEHTRERYDSFITRDDIARIASWGLDHIRLPFDNELIEDVSGTFIDGGFMSVFEGFEDDETIGAGFFETIFKPAIQTAKKHGVPLYCGEYGVIDNDRKTYNNRRLFYNERC